MANSLERTRTSGFYLRRERRPSQLLECAMANLVLVYGMRLLPAEDLEEVPPAAVQLRGGRQARITMHILEGSKEEIEAQLRTSVQAFFDFYPEI
jgi:hypothetical protein